VGEEEDNFVTMYHAKRVFSAATLERWKLFQTEEDKSFPSVVVVGVNHRKNDPAAGSPTATLLRLLLPLLKKCR
jgi:hypothetical protein